MAFLNSFYHWNAHNLKDYIYTIQKVIFFIWLFNITFLIGDALN